MRADFHSFLFDMPGRAAVHARCYTSLDAVTLLAEDWLAFEKTAVSSSYQKFDWCQAWYRHVSPSLGEQPCVLVITDEKGTWLAAFAFAIMAKAGVRIGRFIGLTHSNFNMGLFDPDAIATFSASALRRLLVMAGKHVKVDAWLLRNQPYVWQGASNPLRQPDSIPSPSAAYRADLPATPDAMLERVYETTAQRKKLRNKRSVLRRQGNFVFSKAASPEEGLAFFRAFYSHKQEWFLQKKIKNPFQPVAIQNFFEDVAKGTIDLYALRDGNRYAAVFGTMTHAGRMSALFISVNTHEAPKGSPGELLLLDLMMDCCANGLICFDLGVGEAHYKYDFCPLQEALFDTAIAVTPKGHGAARLWRGLQAAKRLAKKNPRLLHVLEKIRSKI